MFQISEYFASCTWFNYLGSILRKLKKINQLPKMKQIEQQNITNAVESSVRWHEMFTWYVVLSSIRLSQDKTTNQPIKKQKSTTKSNMIKWLFNGNNKICNDFNTYWEENTNQVHLNPYEWLRYIAMLSLKLSIMPVA